MSREHRNLQVHDAAAWLGLSKSKLDKMRVYGGGPPYLKLGRRVLYDTRDLDEWSAAHRRLSTSCQAESGTVLAR